jgi:uncharacterized cupin superfamily protein
VDRIELGPADYSGMTLVNGLEGLEGFVCRPGDGRQVSAVGVFACEPSTYVSSPLKADETVLMLEGELRVEADDGSAAELGAGDIAVLRKGSVLTWIHKTPCKEVFVTCRPPAEG